MNQFSERPDPRSEVHSHLEEMLNPEYVQNTGEFNSRVDFIEALDIYLSSTDFNPSEETMGVVGFIKTLKDSNIADELKKKAEEKGFDLKAKMEDFLDDSDENTADEILSFVKESIE